MSAVNSFRYGMALLAEEGSRRHLRETYASDPEGFICDVLKVSQLTPDQIGVIRAMLENQKVAVTAGNSVGKTFLSACLALWFFYTKLPSKVVTTAPTNNQVENLLWRDIRSLFARANAGRKRTDPLWLYGDCLTKRIEDRQGRDKDPDHFALGFATNEETNFQGFHSPNVLLIFDEATGIPKFLWNAGTGIVMKPTDKWLAFGNPTDPTSEFKQRCDSGLWKVREISGENHPNVKSGEILIDGAVTREWIEEREVEYGGRDSSLYRARVLGKWPEEGSDALFPLHQLEASQSRYTGELGGIAESVGVDVAGRGKDASVVCSIFASGDVGLSFPAKEQQFDTGTTNGLMSLVGFVHKLAAKNIGVDDAGIGGGVTSRLMELGNRVIACVGAQSATDKQRYYNFRSEIYWALSTDLINGELNLPDDRMLIAELSAISVGYHSDGRVKLITKEELVKKIGRSPDRADALAIANWARKNRGAVPPPVASSKTPPKVRTHTVVEQRIMQGLPPEPWMRGRRR